ncbi:hypothetical protein [Virgibacillus halodenitrificans]|uniref:hypothetical protein n=1 Tax=Virgibacillus halodenitrificans TaxID=1482 RepID=UPI000EF44B62|nr:hypothetical protein [Virgibacillus halodenitrificans]
MLKELDILDKETYKDIFPLCTKLNRSKNYEKRLIDIQKKKIEELKRVNGIRAFELDNLKQFIKTMGIENDYHEFREGYLAGIKKQAH